MALCPDIGIARRSLLGQQFHAEAQPLGLFHDEADGREAVRRGQQHVLAVLPRQTGQQREQPR
ncbi:MAG: hypothetical protein WDN06_13365 [Asticcacaulis sp.]